MPHHGIGPIRFASYLALAWCGLVVYGSLHPFTGWRDTGVSPIAFLEGGWPRYWTAFDLAANVAVYLPLGFFLTLALSRLPGRLTAAALATLCAGGLSFGLETVQTCCPHAYRPTSPWSATRSAGCSARWPGRRSDRASSPASLPSNNG